jgi:succinoglycan biosynthesis protein ExoM
VSLEFEPMLTLPQPATRMFDVAVCVCTHQRNEPLRRALIGIERALNHLHSTHAMSGAIVVVDDNPNGEAKVVVDEVRAATGRHIEYTTSGRKNISLARNEALDTGFAIAHSIALLDDDGEPWDDWLTQLYNVRDETSADIVTGPYAHKPPADSPGWLLKSPFLSATDRYVDKEEPPYGCTANALLRSAWFDEHPVRFQSRLGTIGGEDMVFFHEANVAGARHRYALNAVVWEVLPPERATFRYQMYAWTWFGNTEAVTNIERGSASRPRLIARAARRTVKQTSELALRCSKPGPPAGRYWAVQVGRSAGLVLGAAGIRLEHK